MADGYLYQHHERRAPTPPFAPVFLGLGQVESSRAATYPRHRHRHYELIAPLAGGYRCRLNGIAVALGADQVLVVKPGDWHEDQLAPGSRHAGVWFRLSPPGAGDGASLPLFAAGTVPEQQAARLPAGRLRPLLDALIREHLAADPSAGGLQDALCASVFWLAARALDPAALSPAFVQASAAQAFPAQVRAVLQRHLASPLGVGDLARELGVSVRVLHQRCTALLGAPPARVIAAFKMEHAVALLRDTGWTVTQVSDWLGFANPFHFARVFRRVHGRSPSDFRSNGAEQIPTHPGATPDKGRGAEPVPP